MKCVWPVTFVSDEWLGLGCVRCIVKRVWPVCLCPMHREVCLVSVFVSDEWFVRTWVWPMHCEACLASVFVSDEWWNESKMW